MRFSGWTGSLAHLHSHQPRDQDRQVKLAGDTFGHRRVTGLQGYRSDVAETDGRQRSQAEVDENRKGLLFIRNRRECFQAEAERLA